ncbi:MAG: methyltransferase domain-containing protein, partial [Rubrobacteraceae bacterium]|nr:methyltransferase domain-containing protein [Rubrobacteraceae bacterium]
ILLSDRWLSSCILWKDEMLDTVVHLLRCPVCHGPLCGGEGVLYCGLGHSHDVARQGYVSLFAPPGRVHTGDSARMIAARERFLGSGFYDPIAEAVVSEALGALGLRRGREGCVVDLGAGTGYYLARLLEALPGWRGLALDASAAALRRAARANPRIGAVGCDVWRELPVADGAVALVLDIFAPRNAAEISRILEPDGVLIVVTARKDHLRPLSSLPGMLSVEEDRPDQIEASLSKSFDPLRRRSLDFYIHTGRESALDAVMMGPSARHVEEEEVRRHLGSMPEPLKVEVSVEIMTLRRVEAL